MRYLVSSSIYSAGETLYSDFFFDSLEEASRYANDKLAQAQKEKDSVNYILIHIVKETITVYEK